MEVYQVLEIAREGKPSGKYRYTKTCDGITYGLCDHEHSSYEEAKRCWVAKEKVDKAFGRDAESLKRHRDQLERELAETNQALAVFAGEGQMGNGDYCDE